MVTKVSEVKDIVKKGIVTPQNTFSEIKKMAENDDWKVREVAATVLVEISKKYANLRIVIAHFFWPKMEYCYGLTKDLKNIYYDTSAMADPEVIETTGGWDKILKILKKTVLQKPNNVVFGTDWPMCPVDKHIELIKEMKLGAEIEEKIFFLMQLSYIN